jgi:membrane fusion protein (multidrug efflux system)
LLPPGRRDPRELELFLVRQQSLAARRLCQQAGAGSRASQQGADRSAVQGAQAGWKPPRQYASLQAQREEAARTAEGAETTAIGQGRSADSTFNRSIKAPIDGVIGNRAMQVGDTGAAGQRLASLVPLDADLCRRELQGNASSQAQARPAGADRGRLDGRRPGSTARW